MAEQGTPCGAQERKISELRIFRKNTEVWILSITASSGAVVQLWKDRYMEHWVKNWLNDRAPKVVTNGVPLGLFQGPVLFNAFINNLDAGIGYTNSKSVEDTKMGGVLCFFETQKVLERKLGR